MGVTGLPDHVLGSVFSHLTSPADRMSVLLVCKRFLAAAAAHSPAWWESLKVSDNKGDRQGSFWMAHHQKVRSLDVAVTAKGGGPGVFLQLAEGLAGLPALEMLKIMAPFGRNSGIMQVWMEQAFQVINRLSTLRHLHVREQEAAPPYILPDGYLDEDIQKQTLPLLLAPGALPNLQSLALDSRWGLFMVEVPRGALRLLSSLTQLHFNAQLVRGSSASGYPWDLTLGWADLEGTTALRQLDWDAMAGGRLSLSESEALSLLGRLEQLSVAPAECFSPGIWAALPQLDALTRVDLEYYSSRVYQEEADPAPMCAVAACRNLKALSTNWLPPIELGPCQLSSLTRLVLNCTDMSGIGELGGWFAAMPAVEAVEVYAQYLPPGMEALPSLKSLYFLHTLDVAGDALDRISTLPHLTSLELVSHHHTWPLPHGPYLSNLRSLALKWADAAAPIPTALAGALCLTSLTLFTCEHQEQQTRIGNSVYHDIANVPVPPACWEDDDVALLRALPSPAKVELVAFIERKAMDSKVGELAPEWQQSAEALAAQLPGVGVAARTCTREEAQARSFWARL